MPRDVTLTQFSLDSKEIKASRKSSRSSGVRTLSGSSSKSKSKKSKKTEETESSVYIPQFNQSLKIIGVGLSNDDIADYIENLRDCELLDNVELKYIKESKIDGVLLRSFELSTTIRKDADARGLVEKPAPVEMPDVRSPDRLVPQMPLLLPPSVEEDTSAIESNEGVEEDAGDDFEFEVFEEGDLGFEEEEGDVVLTMPSLPTLPSFGKSESVWGSPEGWFDLMGSAARTAERVRSEKAAQELLENPVVTEDEALAEEAEAEESAEVETDAEDMTDAVDGEAETEAVEEAPAAEDAEPAPAGFWFDDSDTEEDETPATGDADESGDDDKEDE